MKTRLANQSVVLTAFLAICFGFLLFWLALADIPVRAQASEPVYADLSEDDWHYEYVAALKDMGVFEGTECEEGFCPGDPLERWQMAVWLVRILDGQDPEPINESRFADVGDYSEWIHFIDRLADLGVTAGCKEDPPRYCPQRAVNRSQMAVFLYRAFKLPDAAPAGFTDVSENSWAYGYINALSASGITAGCKKEPFNYCPSHSVTRAQMATFLYRALEWREENSKPAIIEDANPGVFLTEENELSRFIRNKIVEEYAGENPWLMEVWNYTNRPGFEYDIGKNNASLIHPSYESTPTLLKVGATKLSTDPNCLNDPYCWTNLVHEMAHVYTLVNDASSHPTALAAAHLYFEQLAGDTCDSIELYADAAPLLVPMEDNIYSPYWHSCEHLPQRVTAEAEAVVRDAFSGKMPAWFYDTFQEADGSLDYEAVWTAVKKLRYFERVVVVYQFKDAFGGYCSDSAAKKSAFENSNLAQPWRDGGCQ